MSETVYPKFFRGRRILITGGAGFLGSNLAHALVSADATVTILDAVLPLYGANPVNLGPIAERLRVLEGDVRNQDVVERAVAGQDYVFHLAAQVSYLDSLETPLLDLDINARGTLVLLGAIRHLAPAAKVVFASSRLVYGKILTTPVDESHPTDPLSIYGVHKLAAEKYCRIAYERHATRTTVLRLPNPYGPRQQVKHAKYSIVGWFVRQALEGKDLTVFGDGCQERDYLYVDDITQAFLAVASTRKTDGEVYNLGTDERVRFVDMVNAVIAGVGKGRRVHLPWPAGYEKNETGDYVADTRKIERAVSWRARVSLREGIARTVAFYRAHAPEYFVDVEEPARLAEKTPLSQGRG